MPSFSHALIITIKADDYEQSEKIAVNIADSLANEEETSVIAGHFYGQEEDNSGQRVIYLHPAGMTNDWEEDDE